MKTKIQLILLALFLSVGLQQCTSEKKLPKNTMLVEGTVDGLRRGTLYLQKMQDTLLVAVDSVKVEGDSQFQFTTPLEHAEVYYLYLNKKDGDSLNDRIMFFGEPGKINIQTRLRTFESSAQITGSKNQELLHEFYGFVRKFNSQRLDLLEDFLNAQKDGLDNLDSYQEQLDQNTKRQYLYALNFATNHADYDVAPFIVLSEIYDTQLHFLDSLATKMTPEVKASFYGKKFVSFLEERRAAEQGEN